MKRRLRRALATPFPDAWRAYLDATLPWWQGLSVADRATLEDLVRMFLADTTFEAAGGLELSEEMELHVAAEACRLVLGIGFDWFRDVTVVILYPTSMRRSGDRRVEGQVHTAGPVTLGGESMLHGPLVLAWNEVVANSRWPARGRNVVYHEFAHKLDMLDGAADGVPPLRDRDAERGWAATIAERLAAVRSGETLFFDPYAATNGAELFAVATEAFFQTPQEMALAEPAMYGLLRGFYRQDPVG